MPWLHVFDEQNHLWTQCQYMSHDDSHVNTVARGLDFTIFHLCFKHQTSSNIYLQTMSPHHVLSIASTVRWAPTSFRILWRGVRRFCRFCETWSIATSVPGTSRENTAMAATKCQTKANAKHMLLEWFIHEIQVLKKTPWEWSGMQHLSQL